MRHHEDCLLVLEADVNSVYRRWEHDVLSLIKDAVHFFIYTVILSLTISMDPGWQVLLQFLVASMEVGIALEK